MLRPLRTFRAFLLPFGTFASLVTLASASALGAEFARASIEQRGKSGAECSSTELLTNSVELRLQRRLFAPMAEADLKVVVTFGRASHEWIADIDLFAAQGKHLGHRRIISPTRECSGLDESLALVVALMVDLTKEDVISRSTPTLPPPADGTTEVRVPAQPDEPNPWSAVLSSGLIATSGQLPGIGLGLGLATELRTRKAWAIAFGVQAFPPVTMTDGATAQATFAQYGAEIGGCWFGARRDTSDLLLCAGSQFGVVRASGSGYTSNRSAQVTSINPFLKAEATWWPWPRFGLRLGFGALSPLMRDHFYATRADGSEVQLFKPAIFVPFLQAGLCLAL